MARRLRPTRARSIGAGSRTYGEVAGHVAEHLFRHDHSRAGWLGDIGLLCPWYRRHACQVLEQLDGTLAQIDSV